LSPIWPMFGKWIKERREDLRLSQGEVAKRAGIDRQQVYRIEAGKSGTKRETVLAIAGALELDTSEALNRAGYSSSHPDKPRNVLEFVRALEALGVSHIEMFGGPDVMAKMTPDDFESILSEVRRAVEREIFKKVRE
jgi:transcriptional regulator with XRE-family HTH domain